jgi:hypothetical protein
MRTENQCNCENSYCEQHDIHAAAGCTNEGKQYIQMLGLVCAPCCLTYPLEYHEFYDHPLAMKCEHCGELVDDCDTWAEYEKRKATCTECKEEFEHEARCDEYEHPYERDDDDYSMFANPGGNSALRAETHDNPRNLPCPTCGAQDVLTPADRALGYQCDRCADRAEGGMEY